MPIIVVSGEDQIEFARPLQWVQNPAHEGGKHEDLQSRKPAAQRSVASISPDSASTGLHWLGVPAGEFTCQSDRERVSSFVRTALDNKLRRLRASGQIELFRHLDAVGRASTNAEH